MIDKAEYIITLVGKNPSPNYYTILNYGYEKTKVFEVYTLENRDYDSSRAICNNLTDALLKKNPELNIEEIPSDKSKKINDVCKSIFNTILEDCNYENLGSNTVNLIVDYTGGTKSMAAAFYMYFQEIVQFSDYEKLDITASYVSSEKAVIYQSNFITMEIRSYQLENLFIKYNISREDLIDLHGYKIQNEEDSNICIIKADSKNAVIKYEYNKVDIYKSNLRFTINLQIKKIKKLIDRYFEIDDEVEKIGGSEAFVNCNIIGYDCEEKIDSFDKARGKFYSCLSGVYNGLEEKVNINFVEVQNE